MPQNYRQTYGRKPYAYRGAEELSDLYFGRNSFEMLWVGPRVPPEADPMGTKTQELKRAFREHNLLREVVDNWKDGLVAKPFTITVKSGADVVKDSDALPALQRWIAKVNEQAIQSDPAASEFNQSDPWQEFVLSLGVLGQATLRLWQRPNIEAIEDALCLHVPRPGATTVEYDDYTFIESITYQSGPIREVHRSTDGTMEIELTRPDAPPVTLEIDTQGRWFIQVMHGEPLLTDSAISKQQGLCHDLTMLMRNQEHAGFKRRTLLNAELPDVDEEYAVGPGIDEYLPGIAEQQLDGSMRYTTPSVHESQPFPVDNFEKSIDIWSQLIYREFRQAHMMDTGSSALSGESRIQMRASMLLYLERWSRRIEAAFGSTLTLVAQLLGYEGVDVVVDLNLSTGVMSADERRELVAEHQAGLLSRATAIALLGSVSDPDAEIEALEAELKDQTKQPKFEPDTDVDV